MERDNLGRFIKGNTISKGHIAWNKGGKNPKIAGKNNHQWKGDNVSYNQLHKWVVKYLGKPNVCEHCGKSGLSSKQRQIDWANKSHEYKRDLSDWIRLCKKCHYHYDRG